MSKISSQKTSLKIGFFINPYAGAGGPAALKGSDSCDTKAAILRGDIDQRSPERARQFLDSIDNCHRCEFLTVPGAMGEELLVGSGCDPELPYQVLAIPAPYVSSAADTRKATQALWDAAVDLLVFVGGDGTARDVCSVLNDRLPVLGVPSGVKMHSGVFAITPVAAAKVLNDIVSGQVVSLVKQEVRDIDEQAFQKGIVKSHFFGSMWVPDELRYIQSVKHGSVEVDELVLVDIAAEIRERLEDEENHDALVIFATGSTTQFVQSELNCPGTLLGVDVCFRGELIALDVNATQLERLVMRHAGKVVLVLTAIGGQGHILGRGNQQLTPAVLRRVGRDNIWVIATKTKLKALAERPLLMDSNDPSLDSEWQGLIPVITGYRDQALYRLGVDLEN